MCAGLKLTTDRKGETAILRSTDAILAASSPAVKNQVSGLG